MWPNHFTAWFWEWITFVDVVVCSWLQINWKGSPELFRWTRGHLDCTQVRKQLLQVTKCSDQPVQEDLSLGGKVQDERLHLSTGELQKERTKERTKEKTKNKNNTFLKSTAWPPHLVNEQESLWEYVVNSLSQHTVRVLGKDQRIRSTRGALITHFQTNNIV